MNFKYKITPEQVPSTGILYVDHEKNFRSGHLSHALVEFRKNCILSFYSNCSGTRNPNSPGHNGFGWLEYRRSYDGGLTWDDARILQYSYDSLINQPFTVSCEKAVSIKENQIVAFCTRNINPNGWEPHIEPVVLMSEDAGETWSDPSLFCNLKGRIFDALVHDGIIYVLFHASPNGFSTCAEDKHLIYTSNDGGKSFVLHAELPFHAVSLGYGNMVLTDDGALICYVYNEKDENNLEYCKSYDMGLTWNEIGKSFCAKRIRNPQVGKVKGGYILHGRAGCMTEEHKAHHFVLYTSKDGINWDDGIYLCDCGPFSAYYSNNLVMNNDDGSQRVLIQSSVPYSKGRVNIAHWFLDIE